MTGGLEQLQELGFSQYEAQAYIALLRESPLNGYELARASGIPRPNIYPVLHKLEERGAVLRLDTPDGARYTPVPPAELLAKLKQRYQATLEDASLGLEQITTAPTLETILNLRGYALLLEHAQALIENATQHLLLSVWPEEAAALAPAIDRALQRGVQIITLCLRGCPQPCPACRGEVFRYAIAPVGQQRWLVVVADESELLAGEIAAGGALAVRTRQSMLVNLSAGYIQNSIALASILSGMGDRLETALDAQSAAAINALHPLRAEGAWLDSMKRMLRLNNKTIP